MKLILNPLAISWIIYVSVLILTGTTDAVDHLKYKRTTQSTLPNRYIIEFQSHTLGGASAAESSNRNREFVQAIHQKFNKDNVLIRHHFDHALFNGISLAIQGLDHDGHKAVLQHIGDHPTTATIYPVTHVARPMAVSSRVSINALSDVSAALPHAMTQVDRVHREMNKGEGVLIGIVDTGIDYMHPALGGGFGPGYKVRYGADLVGDDFDSKNNDIKPSDTPYDNCPPETRLGHGTHVAGIIGGYDPSQNFVGVAPNATLGMWRIFGCDGGSDMEIIAKAILLAYDAGCDIISLSLGSINGWSDDGLDTVIAQRLSEKGVYVIAGAGNSGTSGAFTMGNPSAAKDVVSVTSFNNRNYIGLQLLTNGSLVANITYEYAIRHSRPFPHTEIVLGEEQAEDAPEQCTPSSISRNLIGKIALVYRNNCDLDEKYKLVTAAGAVAMIVINEKPIEKDRDIFFRPLLDNNEAIAIGVSHANGTKLIAAIHRGPVFVVSTDKQVIVPNPVGDKVTDFSSIGSANSLELKPNIAGVGGSVYSTLPLALGGWGVMSGTSMSTPYVTGAYALFLSSLVDKKAVSAKFILERLQNYAYIVSPLAGDNSVLENPVIQGAGLVQVYDAIKEVLHVSPGQLSFNDTSPRNTNYKKQSLMISNNGQSSLTLVVTNNISTSIVPYDLKNTGYVMVEPANITIKEAAHIHFSKETIQLEPGESETIAVTAIPPKTNPDLHVIYGGFIQFRALGDIAKDVHVPYFGIVGDQRKLPIFGKGTPYITDASGEHVYGQNETIILDHQSLANLSLSVVARFVSPTEQVVSELLRDADESVIGFAQVDITHIGRSMLGESEPKKTFSWNGTYAASSAPSAIELTPIQSGRYRLRWKALRWLGDENNIDDYEIWTSGPIIVNKR